MTDLRKEWMKEDQLQLHLLRGRFPTGTVAFGSVWPQGMVRDCDFEVRSEGRSVPAQSVGAAFWPDGSVKWARHTTLGRDLGETLTVRPGKGPAPETAILVTADDAGGVWHIQTACLKLDVPYPGTDTLVRDVWMHGKKILHALRPLFLFSSVQGSGYAVTETVCPGKPIIRNVVFEEQGDVALALCFQGVHDRETGRMPFEIRLRLGWDSEEIRVTNTLFFHGDEHRDRMKGLALESEVPLSGEACNHHVQFMLDGVRFHEPAQLLESRIPRTGPDMKREQLQGLAVRRDAETEAGKLLEEVRANMPVWNRYRMIQIGQDTCTVLKRTKPGMCAVPAFHARRGNGVMAVTGEEGGVMVGLRDFAERYPSELAVEDLGGHSARVTVWFWSPEAQAFDFAHYDDRSYESSYEGFSYFGATPEGIAVTSEAVLKLLDRFAGEEELKAFASEVQHPAVYVAEPEVYHALRAFGYWGLVDRESEEGSKLEDDLDSAVDYYVAQRAQRGWYGFFDYGDFRHSYDPDRHTWKYDIGGFAWQQTELVPTYWLWLQFMRTGREDIFSLAEAMSRNTSEVDCYHFGPMKGLGSRHNVRHWGCPCKEPRVSMAGHHRPLYYLTGDLRMGACMQEMADAHLSLSHVRWYTENPGEVRCRTAPDWSSLLSDWMTAFERTGSRHYVELAERGMTDLCAAPLGFASGPIFAFDPETGGMRYIGESTGNIHLTQCFATTEILLEASEAMDLPGLRDMLVHYGDIYLMTAEEREAAFGDLVRGKGYSMRYTAGAMGAYSGFVRDSMETKKRAWHELLLASPRRHCAEGFQSTVYAVTDDGREMREIPWMSTNYISQWCLNTVMLLEFARDAMPSLAEAEEICREAYRLEL